MKARPDTAGDGASCVKPFASGADTDCAPVFSEAWHAQALAIADSLIRAGRVSPAQWSAALGAALEKNTDDRDAEDAYYTAVLGAVETLGTRLDGMSEQTLDARTEAWRAAYLSTPHGEPVKLADASDDADSHDTNATN